MTAKILSFTGDTLIDLKAEDVLDAAKEVLQDAVVIGWTKEDEFYIASTTSHTGDIFLLLQMAQALLIEKLKDGD